MTDDHTSNPRGPTPPVYDPGLKERTTGGSCNLVEGLGEMVDDIRQIASDLGARPYTYHSVTVEWSGGVIGRGEAKVVKDTAIVPTPETRPVGYLDRDLDPGGVAERGDVTLTGISPRFTEELFALQRAIRTGDGAHLFDYFTRTRAIRRGIIEAGQDTDAPDFGRVGSDPGAAKRGAGT